MQSTVIDRPPSIHINISERHDSQFLRPLLAARGLYKKNIVVNALDAPYMYCTQEWTAGCNKYV